MSIYSKTADTGRACFQEKRPVRFPGRPLRVATSIYLLWQKGVRFSQINDKSRRTNPLQFMPKFDPKAIGELENATFYRPSEDLRNLPAAHRCVVLPKKIGPLGNKCWGRIDFLVNHCGFRFIDERK